MLSDRLFQAASAGAEYEGILKGSALEFEAGATTQISMAKLSASSVVICYRDGADGQPKVVVARNLDGTPTLTTPVSIDGGSDSDFISVDALSETTAVVIYRDGTSSDDGNGNVLTSLDGTPSVGSQFLITANNPRYNEMVALTSSTAVVFYRSDIDSDGEFVVLSSLDGTPSVGSIQTFRTGTVLNSNGSIGAFKLSSTVAVVCWGEASSTGRYVVITSLDGSPSVGSENTFNSTSITHLAAAGLGSTSGVVVFVDSGGSGDLETVTLTDLTTSPNESTPFTIDTGTIINTAIDKLTPTSAIFAWRVNVAAPNNGRTVDVTALTTSPVLGTEFGFTTTDVTNTVTRNIAIAVSTSTLATIGFADPQGNIQRVE